MRGESLMTIKTIRDNENGDVWTGKAQPDSYSPIDLVFDLVTAGGYSISGATESQTKTVTHNGVAHTGREIK
jgi:hypothetical protein